MPGPWHHACGARDTYGLWGRQEALALGHDRGPAPLASIGPAPGEGSGANLIHEQTLYSVEGQERGGRHALVAGWQGLGRGLAGKGAAPGPRRRPPSARTPPAHTRGPHVRHPPRPPPIRLSPCRLSILLSPSLLPIAADYRFPCTSTQTTGSSEGTEGISPCGAASELQQDGGARAAATARASPLPYANIVLQMSRSESRYANLVMRVRSTLRKSLPGAPARAPAAAAGPPKPLRVQPRACCEAVVCCLAQGKRKEARQARRSRETSTMPTAPMASLMRLMSCATQKTPVLDILASTQTTHRPPVQFVHYSTDPPVQFVRCKPRVRSRLRLLKLVVQDLQGSRRHPSSTANTYCEPTHARRQNLTSRRDMHLAGPGDEGGAAVGDGVAAARGPTQGRGPDRDTVQRKLPVGPVRLPRIQVNACHLLDEDSFSHGQYSLRAVDKPNETLCSYHH
jgi:hypothetical protein